MPRGTQNRATSLPTGRKRPLTYWYYRKKQLFLPEPLCVPQKNSTFAAQNQKHLKQWNWIWHVHRDSCPKSDFGWGTTKAESLWWTTEKQWINEVSAWYECVYRHHLWWLHLERCASHYRWFWQCFLSLGSTGSFTRCLNWCLTQRSNRTIS